MEVLIIALDKQIHLYMVDTSCFYNEKERILHNILNKNYKFRNILKKKLNSKKIKNEHPELIPKIEKYIANCSKRIPKLKNKLVAELKVNTDIRTLDENSVNIRNVISMFDSNLSRTLGIPINTFTKDIIIVQTYFFDVLENIILNGFMYEGEEYIFFTASAGQIRTKKSVFIKKSLYEKYKETLMCGLTIEHINSLGGINTNKFIAYMALCNSATDVWEDFNIDKAIVVDDMETMVEGLVDFINYETYKITRQTMKVPITHTDGCGMILPQEVNRNMMVRLPWIKGLLSPFAFNDFINVANENMGFESYGKVKDIYGKEWDLIKDGIEVIFTKSQFKMWKYYPNDIDEDGNIIKYGWDKYKDNFKRYNCQACKCNEEEDIIGDSTVSYQVLQTLTDITFKELEKLCQKTKQDILNVGSDLKTMLKVLGVTEYNTDKNYLQQAIELYPELLEDTYSKEILKNIKRSMVKRAFAGKLKISNSKYTFIVPDLYSFCEYLILGDKNPKGLLQDQEVYCNLYRGFDKLDCVRSPHLYREHGIRSNIIDDEKDKWFITKGLYTSCHDLISKMLQFDVDGDRSLVLSDPLWVKIAEHNMKGIVPLYYEMKTSKNNIINNQSIYDGLIYAYKSGNIGLISNDITKIWNSENINLDMIKLLCLETNYTIDSAKTLYKIKRPDEINKEIRKYTKCKLPYFFIYAKDKTEDQVRKRNKSTVNILQDIIPNNNINFKSVGLESFDYKMLTYCHDEDITSSEAQLIIDKYNELDLKKYFMINRDRMNEDDYNNLVYTYQTIRNEIYLINDDLKFIVDVLVKYLYEQKRSNHKTTLWSSFGDVIVDNIERNIKRKLNEGYIQCIECGKLVIPKANNQKYCPYCWKEVNKEQIRLRVVKYRNVTVQKTL